MLRTMKRFTALSLGTIEPEASQNTRFTCCGQRRGEGEAASGVARGSVVSSGSSRRCGDARAQKDPTEAREVGDVSFAVKAERGPPRRVPRPAPETFRPSASRCEPHATLDHGVPRSALLGKRARRADATTCLDTQGCPTITRVSLRAMRSMSTPGVDACDAVSRAIVAQARALVLKP